MATGTRKKIRTSAASVITSEIPYDHLEAVAGTLRVLAHPLRLKLVEILLGGPVAVGDLAEEVQTAQAAVSQHLSQMRAHGIVAPRREGRLVFYEVVDPHAPYLIGCIRRHM